MESAIARPLASTKEDDFVGRMLWALSDRHGLPAQRFADLDPVPSLDWLAPLSEARFGHIDLARYGVPPNLRLDENFAFSLMRRPMPYSLAPLHVRCRKRRRYRSLGCGHGAPAAVVESPHE